MSIRDNLIPREKIPPGCQYRGGTWYEPPDSGIPDDDARWIICQSWAYYNLMDALTELVDTAVDLERAKERHQLAMSMLRVAAGRREYIANLPAAPWLIKGHVIEADLRSERTLYQVKPVFNMDIREPTPKPGYPVYDNAKPEEGGPN